MFDNVHITGRDFVELSWLPDQYDPNLKFHVNIFHALIVFFKTANSTVKRKLKLLFRHKNCTFERAFYERNCIITQLLLLLLNAVDKSRCFESHR